MRGRKPKPLVLKSGDVRILKALVSDGQIPWQVARRAQILLRRSQNDQRVGELAALIERDAATVWRVCQRYRQSGLAAALYDAPRTGRPRVFSLR